MKPVSSGNKGRDRWGDSNGDDGAVETQMNAAYP